ncbi:ribonuclease H-like domain-containing protein [Phyllosticta capitalensis]
MSGNSGGERYGIHNRLYRPSPLIGMRDFEVQYCPCPDCGLFFYKCSDCKDQDEDGYPCPGTSVVFTDGACLNNGQDGASAGWGVAFGTEGAQQFSVPMGNVESKTSQRAELEGAIAGLTHVMDYYKRFPPKKSSPYEGVKKQFVLTTDSEYVVKGMTEWLPNWKSNGYRTSTHKKPANLDLFMRLDKLIEGFESEDVVIGFLHIPREHNKIADKLAKRAAKVDQQQSKPL